ncbi:MAG TPA: glycosyltransferase family 4 protein [Solirubrobacterales bacterium]|jgi:glycosyltransferase involved in cell wall biosynthesis|nr:glycosyltransferase family 4 protein [Solirubrobacterales bacterium]
MTTKAAGSLRILMVSDEWRPFPGGAGLCMGLFARELAERGHTVAVATAWNDDAPAVEVEGGVTVHRLRELPSRADWVSDNPARRSPTPFPDPEAVLRLRRLIGRFEPDLIPAYGWFAHSAVVALSGRDVPLVLWNHDYANVCAMRTLYRHDREICSGPAPRKCLSCAVAGRGRVKGTISTVGVLGMRPLVRRKAAALHSVSHYVASTLERELPAGATPSVVIENFHRQVEPGEPDAAVMARLPTEPFILFVGTMSRVKGVEDLLAAYRELDSPPPLVLAGYRTTETPTEFPSGVTVLTDVPHPTVMAMWDRALFGVFPSKWAEPLATVVHEAMSRGRPVIGTRPGGYEDMIDDGESGFIVPASDPGALAAAMDRLASDDSLRARMGTAAGERAESFTSEIVVPKLERFYRETVERHRARS